ncbi:hypothetical protein CAAN1_04S00980 [[Candida] anglica]|uniref:DUF3020 domain-containing protein n=1 Tax=[Candida] anglica TaxID=148631 RepID=A0ABP0EC12_9ASCO
MKKNSHFFYKNGKTVTVDLVANRHMVANEIGGETPHNDGVGNDPYTQLDSVAVGGDGPELHGIDSVDGGENNNNNQNNNNNDGSHDMDQDDIDLQNAIGDVFGQFDFGQLSHEDKEEGGTDQGEIVAHGQGVEQEMSHEVNVHSSSASPQPNNIEYQMENNDKEESDDDFDLSAAIGDAFAMVGESKLDEAEPSTEQTLDDSRSAQVDEAPVEQEQHQHGASQAEAEEVAEAVSEEVVQLEEEEQEEDDNLDLEAAIGNAFQSITGEHDKAEVEVEAIEADKDTQELAQPSDIQGQSSQDSPKKDMEAGEEVVEEVRSLASDQQQQNVAEKTEAPHVEEDSVMEEDLDLEGAIGDAFRAINEESNALANHDSSEMNKAHEQQEPQQDGLNEDDLNAVISASFKSLLGEEKSDDKPVQFTPEVPSIPETTSSGLNPPDTSHDVDMDMESAINEAFKSAIEPFPSATSSLTSSAGQTVPNPDHSSTAPEAEQSFDLSGVVQNIVNQVVSDNHNATIPEDVLQELALEITNQVQDESAKKKPQHIADMPQIDDNVLAHFQNEAYKDEHGKNEPYYEDNNSLQAALATVVRNAIENNATTLSEGSSQRRASIKPDDAADLEQLRMSEILQNAFNMAMENPHDLLADMEDERPASTSSGAVPGSAVAAALAKLSHPLPSSTTTFLESLNRSQDIDLSSSSTSRRKNGQSSDRIASVAKNIMNNLVNQETEGGHDTHKKTLSIAETLALHRSSMAGRRDYSSIESLEEVLRSEQRRIGTRAPYPSSASSTTSSAGSLALNTQLSNALSSISSHINSNNGGETNLLQVIRQMTNSLSSSKLPGYTFLGSSSAPSVHEIIASYKEKDSLTGITNSLKLARQFLERSQSLDTENKAVSVIDNVLEMFNNNNNTLSSNQFAESSTTNSKELPLEFADIKLDSISVIRDSVISSVSNFTSKSWRVSSFLGEKPKSDTPEYRERVRMENRERKKKWREENAERNKDNDLRSRVLKRAIAMFGEADTPDKKAWVDEEFTRRREKRLAKQKKDDDEKRNKNEYFDSTLDKEKENSLTHDPNFVKSVTDTFNILSGSASKSDPQAAMAATSVATATAAAIYAKTIGSLDMHDVAQAVSGILTSVMDNSQVLGQKDRLLSLSKGITPSFRVDTSSTPASSDNTTTTTGPESEFSNLIKSSSSGPGVLSRISAGLRGYSTTDPIALLNMENLSFNNGEKRKPSTYISQEQTKRPRSISPSSAQRVPMTEDSNRKLSPHNWNPSTLKMPQYKKPESTSTGTGTSSSSITSSVPEPIATSSNSITGSSTTVGTQPEKITSSSPFISNKVGMTGDPLTTPKPKVGLTKPGSFQRPSFAKSDKKRGMGFPTLYSASFKSN